MTVDLFMCTNFDKLKNVVMPYMFKMAVKHGYAIAARSQPFTHIDIFSLLLHLPFLYILFIEIDDLILNLKFPAQRKHV